MTHLTAPIAEGRTAELYDWDGSHVLKLYHTWCPPNWVEHEAHIARVIAEAGIPTPAAGEVVAIDGRRGIVYERVTGISMLDDMRKRPWLLLRHARSLADLQARFHRLTVPGLHAYRDGLRHSIGRASHLPEPQRAQALELLKTLPDGQSLCHGDFHPGNVLITARGPVVIDWMTASLGSRWADVARTSMILTIGVKAAGDMVSPAIRLLFGQFHRTYLNRYRSLVPDGQVELARFGGEMFTPAQMQHWLQRNLDHQAQFGYGLFSVIDKASGRLIGDCGLEQMEAKDETVAELGYDLRSDVWNQGYATEAASAVRDYAFQVLRLPRLISLIRVGNAASQRVAEKIGMQREAEFERYGSRYWRYAIQSMDDIQPILKTLQDALLHKMGDEVELIFQYGSHVRGATHRYSDVDLSWVPVHEATWDSITVLVGDRLADLYPMHWSKLERMAELRDVSASVLLHSRILYQRDEAAGARFRGLAAQLEALQQPNAQPEMLRRALEIFRAAGYDAYLLRLAAEAGHALACLQHTQAILRTVLHCLAVANQAVVDTRKLEQVLALPRLPSDFAATLQRAVAAHEPSELLAATEALLRSTREFLLAEQRRILRCDATLPAVFDSAYPELKRDLQGVLLGCERQDLYALKTSLLSLYHELSRMLAQALTGVEYGSFNSLTEYEQDLAKLGFPALTPYLMTGDLAALHQQCLAFDQHLWRFLTERSVELNAFATLDELQEFLRTT